jgi:hypothetical protein
MWGFLTRVGLLLERFTTPLQTMSIAYYVLPVTTLLRVYLWEWLTGSILGRDKTCGIFYDFTVLQ